MARANSFGCGKSEDNSVEYIVCYFDEVFYISNFRNSQELSNPFCQDLLEQVVNLVDQECIVDYVQLNHHRL